MTKWLLLQRLQQKGEIQTLVNERRRSLSESDIEADIGKMNLTKNGDETIAEF